MMRLSSQVLTPASVLCALCVGLCVHSQQAPQQPAAQPPTPARKCLVRIQGHVEVRRGGA